MSAPSPRDSGSNRREFLTGRAARKEIEKRGEEIADELATQKKQVALTANETIRLTTQAMNCDFSVILNPSQNRRQVLAASDALEIVHAVENSLTVYRPDSELLELNRQAAAGFTPVEPELFALLSQALEIAEQTNGAFNPLARSLNALWRECRQQKRLPDSQELQQALELTRYSQVLLEPETCQIAFKTSGMGFDLGGMGKGYAIDRMDQFLQQEQIPNFLIHGGHSSILARGQHQAVGWPVGIRHPLFPQKRVATLLLADRGFSASGSGVQYFRHQGKRYGHLFDPRTGWPVDHLLSVIVTAPTAAIADALSTAFSVMTIDETRNYCQQHATIGAILFPAVESGSRLKPIVLNLAENLLHWEENVAVQ